MRRTPLALIAAAASAGLVVSAVMASAAAAPTARTSVVPLTTGLYAQLRGGKEVSPAGRFGAGDLDAYGAFSAVVRSPNRLCYSYEVNNLAAPVAAHIHRGARGVNGPVVVPLRTVGAGAPGATAACATVSATLLTQIRTTPAAFYVNVHTAAYPAGAVRGQLFAPLASQDR